MVSAWYADLGERPAADFFAEHEGADACQVGLIRQRQQVEHEPTMLFKRPGDADWLLDDRYVAVTLLLGLLNPALDIPHGVEILRELQLVACAERPVESVRLVGHEVEDAAVLSDAGQPRLHVGAVGGAEQPLEHRARVVFHRQRCRRRAPGDRVHVGAAIALVARTEHLDRIDRQLERRQLCLLAVLLRHDLVQGGAGADVGALGLLHVHPGEPGGCRTRVVAHPFALSGDGDVVGEPGQHVYLPRHRGERLQHRRELERGARACRRPGAHLNPIRHIDGAETSHRIRCRVACCREGRHHAVEQRQRQRGAETPQHRPSGKIFFGDHHGCNLIDYGARVSPESEDVRI